MNVFDFDNTIYQGDSTIDFYLYCLKAEPKIIKWFPKQMIGVIKYKLKIIDKTTLKSDFFSFMRSVKDYHNIVESFWNEHEYKIASWYKKRHQNSDLIISASPEFLLENICKRMNITRLIASKVDPCTGFFQSPNCYGEEKVVRYRQMFEQTKIEEFYSDSYSDKPMAKIANCAYIVKHDKIIPWEED